MLERFTHMLSEHSQICAFAVRPKVAPPYTPKTGSSSARFQTNLEKNKRNAKVQRLQRAIQSYTVPVTLAYPPNVSLAMYRRVVPVLTMPAMLNGIVVDP